MDEFTHRAAMARCVALTVEGLMVHSNEARARHCYPRVLFATGRVCSAVSDAGGWSPIDQDIRRAGHRGTSREMWAARTAVIVLNCRRAIAKAPRWHRVPGTS
jgi:hypothetical protein